MAAAAARANFGDLKVNTIVKNTFLEFSPSRSKDPFDADEPSLHAGRSRTYSDGGFEYGEYAESPKRSALNLEFGHEDSEASTWASDREPNLQRTSSEVPSTVTSDDLQAREDQGDIGWDVTQGHALKEIVGIPWFGSNSATNTGSEGEWATNAGSDEEWEAECEHAFQATPTVKESSVRKEPLSNLWFGLNPATNACHGDAPNAPSYYPVPEQDPYAQNWDIYSSMQFQAAQLSAQAREAEEVAAYLRANAAKLQRREASQAEKSKRKPSNKNQSDIPPAPRLPQQADCNGRSLIDASSSLVGPKQLTTLMLRNIPSSYTRDALLGLIQGMGFHRSCDFIYAPMDFHRDSGLGYAFVNFTTEAEADRAKQMLEGFSAWGVASHKVCEVSYSHPFQGFSEHIDQHRNSCVMHESVPDSHKPAIYEGGVRQPFPAPTRPVAQPRMKRGFTSFNGK